MTGIWSYSAFDGKEFRHGEVRASSESEACDRAIATYHGTRGLVTVSARPVLCPCERVATQYVVAEKAYPRCDAHPHKELPDDDE